MGQVSSFALAMISVSISVLAMSQTAAAGDKTVAIVTDDPEAPAVASLRVLFRSRVTVVDCSTRKLVPGDLEGAEAAVSVLVTPEKVAQLNPRLLAESAEAGAIVVIGLDEYAALIGCGISETRTENLQHVTLDLRDRQAVEAYGKAWMDYRAGKGIDEKWLAVRDSLLEEIREPIPSLEVVADDPALRGYPVGAVVPWCSEGKVYRQQQLEVAELPAGAKVLAVSSTSREPMIVRQDVGKGKVYAMPLRLSPEPRRINWEARGGLNKWIPVSNLLARGILGGTYWNRKPTYAEYCERVRGVAERCPDWKLELVGSYRLQERKLGDIYSFRMGDTSKPTWVIIGMLHAEDEWVPALGALDFIEYVQRHRADPEIARVLKDHAIRVIPFLHPFYHETALYGPEGPRPHDELYLGVTRNDNILAAMQLHQGGESIVTACGTPREMGLLIGEKVRNDIYDGRLVWWRDMGWKGQSGVSAPMQPEDWLRSGVIGGPVPEWDVYWVQGETSCYGIYPIDNVMRAKALHFLEQPMMGFMPDEFTSSTHHHWAHRSVFDGPGYMTLWENDQTVAYCLAFILTPVPGESQRPPDWFRLHYPGAIGD